MNIRNARALPAFFLFVFLVAPALVPAEADAQALSREEGKCVVVRNKGGAGLTKAALKFVNGCLKLGVKGKLSGNALDCVSLGVEGSVLKGLSKFTELDEKKCGDLVLPYGPSDLDTFLGGTVIGPVQDIVDLLGDPLVSPIDPADGKCRVALVGSWTKLISATQGAFNTCKAKAVRTAVAVDDLAACFPTAVGSKKVTKAVAKIEKSRAKKCSDVDVSQVLPGECEPSIGAELSACMARTALCSSCLSIDTMDGLGLDCDALDDGEANGSCSASPGVSSTTTTSTSTSTSTTSTSTTSTSTTSTSTTSTSTTSTSTTSTSTTSTSTTSTTLPASCQAVLSANPIAPSGLYNIMVEGGAREVSCDMTTDGGGWTVFQRREDGSVNFARNWATYEAGFGLASGEHWLGNAAIHELTAGGNHQLYIELSDGSETVFAKYTGFSLGDASTSYALFVDAYSGDAGDALLSFDGVPFSTIDVDNDTNSGTSCSNAYADAGWWYLDCHTGILNGFYLTPGPVSSYADGVTWFPWKGFNFSLTTTKMMLR